MKYLIMCEGPNEKEIIKILLGREYKQINGAHKKDEGYLADLLR